ncbi:MAG: DNA-3-methyladenine glycosylase I [Acetobacterales bacterium]
MSTYCTVAPGHPVHGPYHDSEYGFPTEDERALFERLCLEIFQAGLSWEIVLKKREGMNAAFDDFRVDTIAAYGDADRERLRQDARIIRNRLKIDAIIDNARRVQQLRESHGSFAAWIAVNHPRDKASWVKLFRDTFRFTGGEIVGEFLMSIGYLPGAHGEDCPIFSDIASKRPPWMAVPPTI